jgi:hypothetical protein
MLGDVPSRLVGMGVAIPARNARQTHADIRQIEMAERPARVALPHRSARNP